MTSITADNGRAKLSAAVARRVAKLVWMDKVPLGRGIIFAGNDVIWGVNLVGGLPTKTDPGVLIFLKTGRHSTLGSVHAT